MIEIFDPTPEGWKKIKAEVYIDEEKKNFAICGDPWDIEAMTEDELDAHGLDSCHNCDQMGCGSLDHVIVRGKLNA